MTNPSGTRLLRAYVGWKAKVVIKVTPSNSTPYTHTELVVGIMELRPGGGGLRIWDPWWKYRLSFKNDFGS